MEIPKTPEHKPSKSFLGDMQNRLQKEVLENRRKYLLEKENVCFESANIVPEESWLSNAACKQRNISDPEADKPLIPSFLQLSSPGCSDAFGKSPKVTAGKDFKNCKREEPSLGIMCEKETLNGTKDTQPIAALFEEENHPFPAVFSSEIYHSFSNKNIISQPLTDSCNVNQTSSIYNPPYNVKERPQMASCAKRSPAERNLESIFTVPEQIYLQNTQSFCVLPEEPTKNHLQEYWIQDRNLLMLPEEQKDSTSSESTGGCITQKIKATANMHNYLKQNPEGILAEPNLNHLHIFGLGKTDEEVCTNHSQSSKPSRENDDESQLSSWSPSYFPEQTERCISLTFDESAEEDQEGNASTCYENYIPRNNGNPLAILGSQRSQCNVHSMDTPFILCNSVSWDKANIHPQVKPTIDLRKDDIVLPLQIISHGTFKNKHVNSKARHNAWSQTEKCAWETEKTDAAVQCDLIQDCSCKKEMSSVHSAEIVTSTSKMETTGGQSIPADRAAFQPSSTSSAELVKGLPSERGDYRSHSKIRVGILNYINILEVQET
ncbi:regulator of DNA class I crossover intermediates 1 isoform X2 [Paroedura picta]